MADSALNYFGAFRLSFSFITPSNKHKTLASFLFSRESPGASEISSSRDVNALCALAKLWPTALWSASSSLCQGSRQYLGIMLSAREFIMANYKSREKGGTRLAKNRHYTNYAPDMATQKLVKSPVFANHASVLSRGQA